MTNEFQTIICGQPTLIEYDYDEGCNADYSYPGHAPEPDSLEYKVNGENNVCEFITEAVENAIYANIKWEKEAALESMYDL